MSRARGNARKKKTRLTEQSLSAVMEVAPQREGTLRPQRAVAATGAATEAAGSAVSPARDAARGPSLPPDPDAVVSSILDLLRAEPDATVIPAVYNDPGRVFTGAAGYPAARYVFGLVVCPECRNENMYYQDRDLLAAGYRFRCRICQHELVATLPPDAAG